MSENLKERIWENMEVGEEFGPVQVVVDEHRVKSFAYALDDYDSVNPAGKLRAHRICQSIILCNDMLGIPKTKYVYRSGAGQGLHARQEFEFFRPIRLGHRVTVTGRYVEKYVKREKRYIVLETEAIDEQGRLVARGRSTQMRSLAPGVVKEGPAPAVGAPPAPTILSGTVVAETTKSTPIGAQVRPIAKQVTQEQMTVFTGTEHKNLHTDIEAAQASGLATTVAQGMMSAGYISELMTKFFGNGWRRGGKLNVAFIAPVYRGDTITTSAVVKERMTEGRTERLVLEVWCENQVGRRVTVGTASGLVR